jgi:hypothetical protein
LLFNHLNVLELPEWEFVTMSVLSQSGSGSATIGAAPVVPGPIPGPTFLSAQRDSGDSATDDTKWHIPANPDSAVAGFPEALKVVSNTDQAALDALTDQEVVDQAEVTVPLDASSADTDVDANIPNDLPPGEVKEYYRAVIVYADPQP